MIFTAVSTKLQSAHNSTNRLSLLALRGFLDVKPQA